MLESQEDCELPPPKNARKRKCEDTDDEESSDENNQRTTSDSEHNEQIDRDEDNEQIDRDEEETFEDKTDDKKIEAIASPKPVAEENELIVCDDSIPEFVGSPDAKASDHQDCVKEQQESWNRVKGNKNEIDSTIEMMDTILTQHAKHSQ